MRRLETNDLNTPEQFEKFDVDMVIDADIDKERQEALGGRFEGGKFVDIGCGLFGLCEKMKKKFPQAEIYGLDYSKKIVACCKKNFKGITYKVKDCYNESLSFYK